MIDCRRAYIGTKMELKPEAFKGKMFKVNERKIFLKKIFCRFVSPGRCSLPRYRKEGVTHGREKRSAKSSRL